VKITREVLEGYLSCKYKGHLKLAGQAGTPSDYEAMMSAAKAGSREVALAKLVTRFGQGDTCRGGPVTAAKLKQGAPLLADIDLEGEGLSLRLDALKRADGALKALPKPYHSDRRLAGFQVVLEVLVCSARASRCFRHG
jgi:hypothetical protein